MKKYTSIQILVVFISLLILGCSVGVTGQSDLKTQRQIERERRIAAEQHAADEERRLLEQERERDAEERAMTRMILLQQGDSRSRSSGPITRFTEVYIKADADGPGQEPYAVNCGTSIRLDGTNSVSDAGIPKIQWLITRGALNRESTLTPTYTAPGCPSGAGLGGIEETDVTLIIEDPFGNRSSHTSCITILYPYKRGVIEDRAVVGQSHGLIRTPFRGPENVVPSTPCFQTTSDGRQIEVECPPQNVVVSPIREVPSPPQPQYGEQSAPYAPTCMNTVYLDRLTQYLTALGYTEFTQCTWLLETPSWMTADIYFPGSNVVLIDNTRSEEINRFAIEGYTVFPVSHKMIDDEIARQSNEIFEFIQVNVKRPLINERGL